MSISICDYILTYDSFLPDPRERQLHGHQEPHPQPGVADRGREIRTAGGRARASTLQSGHVPPLAEAFRRLLRAIRADSYSAAGYAHSHYLLDPTQQARSYWIG
jgi:hypothetical protein